MAARPHGATDSGAPSARLTLASCLLVLLIHQHHPAAARKSKSRKASRGGADPAGLYPLFEITAAITSADREIAFADGHTSTIERLGGHPPPGLGAPARAFRVTGLLKPEEAQALVAEAQGQPGGMQASGSGDRGSTSWRDSEQVWVPRSNKRSTSALVRSLNKRVGELTKIPLSVIEDGSIQVARYGGGGHYCENTSLALAMGPPPVLAFHGCL